jgi:hypothetical protein
VPPGGKWLAQERWRLSVKGFAVAGQIVDRSAFARRERDNFGAGHDMPPDSLANSAQIFG